MAEAEIFALAEAVRKHPQENITNPKLRWKSSRQASLSSAATNQQDDCQYMASVYLRTHLYFLQKSTCRLTKWKKCVVSTHEKLTWPRCAGSTSERRLASCAAKITQHGSTQFFWHRNQFCVETNKNVVQENMGQRKKILSGNWLVPKIFYPVFFATRVVCAARMNETRDAPRLLTQVGTRLNQLAIWLK